MHTEKCHNQQAPTVMSCYECPHDNKSAAHSLHAKFMVSGSQKEGW